MIELKVQDRCQECPNFMPFVCTHQVYSSGIYKPNFHIICAHTRFCDKIQELLDEKKAVEKRIPFDMRTKPIEEPDIQVCCGTCKYFEEYRRKVNSDGKIDYDALSTCWFCKDSSEPENPYPEWELADIMKN